MGLIKWGFILLVVGFFAYNHAIREQEKVDVWNYKVKLLTHPHPSVQMKGYYIRNDWRLGRAVRSTAYIAYGVPEEFHHLPYYAPQAFGEILAFCTERAAGNYPDNERLEPPVVLNPLRRILPIYRPMKSPDIFVHHILGRNAAWRSAPQAREVIMARGVKFPMVYPDGWLEAGGRRWGPQDVKELRDFFTGYDFDYPFKD